MKVLVFTSAYSKRPYMIRSTMLGVLNQIYKNITHAVNITLDNDSETTDYTPLYEDLLRFGEFVITYNDNRHTHINNMTAIKSVPDYMNYDLFVKMDSDDIYKSNYVANIVNAFTLAAKQHDEVPFDIVSSKINTQLNGFDLYNDSYDNLGGNPVGSTYKMPMTFAFTKKALKIIENYDIQRRRSHDDLIWRQLWHEAGLVNLEIDNRDEIIWHLHGRNLSTASFLKKPDQYESHISY